MSAPGPDILWILTTQWRARACGHAGDGNARTPSLDRLAAAAVRHTHAVTPHPFGPFARAALLTGVPSPANGVRAYFDPLPEGARTLAHALGERGYGTAWFGKWHLAPRDPGAPLVGEAHARTLVPPHRRGGFSYWDGFEGGFLINDPWVHGSAAAEPVRLAGYQSDVVCARACDWLVRCPPGGPPRFGVVSLEPPHPPYDAPAAGVCPQEPNTLVLDPNVPRGGEVESRARRELAGYYAHIAATDRAIGRLLDAVRDDGERRGRQWRVVVTSVHGDMHGAHGCFRKGWPQEESVGVPLLVASLPQTTPPRIEARPVSLLDLPSLALAWADGGIWEPSGEPVAISMPSVVRLPHQCDRVWSGWHGGDWKVIHEEGRERPWLVYDLAADPWERENLADDPRGAVFLARAREAEARRAHRRVLL